jgi:alkanesulfonate monooxygenase SsuD/methylene tetrahydromethanopterin reductase-like flavin-dependent oxidoreductase (luciferase family)/putative sterol carrier protein
MRFGLFYEHQMPRPWDPGAEERTLQNALDQIELADRVGFDSVWEVEHHFLEEYSHSSAPEVFLAAASQRTKRIRLGHGIVQLPIGFNHPARVAERIATLDLVSGGRVEFGSGEASSQVELGGFQIDRDTKRAQWEEALEAITRMFVEEPFAGFEGAHFSMPQRNVIPKPKQKPHPPLWVACSRRETILMAAQRGIGALSFSFVEPEAAKEWADQYYSIIESEECVPIGFSVNPNLAVVLPMMCHEDEQTAIERGIDGGHFFGYSLAHYYVFGEHEPARTNVWEEFQAHRSEQGFARDIIAAEGEPLGVKLFEQGLGSLRGAIGTPDQITELIDRYERAGVDQVIFVLQAGRNKHEHVCESIELFASRVLPKFAEQADAHDASKRDRLAEACEKALARRVPARAPQPDYVVTVRDEGPRGQSERPESPLAPFIRGKSDEELIAAFGSEDAVQMIFAGMQAAFVPARAEGFTGAIQYELEVNGSVHRWAMTIADGAARATQGAADAPKLVVRSTLPVFLRVASGEMNGGLALMEGKIKLTGDLGVAARLGEMFGDVPRY